MACQRPDPIRAGADQDEIIEILGTHLSSQLQSTSPQGVLHVSWPTTNKLVQAFVGRGILRETTGQRRNRTFRYESFLELFAEPAPVEPGNTNQAIDFSQSAVTSREAPASWPE